MRRPDLGVYSDWVEEAARQRRASAGPLPDVLGFADDSGIPAGIEEGRSWEHDGIAGEEVSWSVGFGPRTHAWVLKPAGAPAPLPGVVALHCHSGIKFYGKEKIADGFPEAGVARVPPVVAALRARCYSDRAYANELARRGFVVVVHDAFLWGSRRFPLADMPPRLRDLGDESPEGYDRATRPHEDLVAKYCALLGTTLAGVVAREDRAAVEYLRSRPDVADKPVGCVGLSGGGCRAALLQATSEHIGAAVVVGMMSTLEHLIDDGLVDAHTWMFLPSGLAGRWEWPEVAAHRAPSPLLVQYDRQDALFSMRGMQAADRMLAQRYAAAGRPDAYVGQFYDGAHKFDRDMQEAAFAWLRAQLHG